MSKKKTKNVGSDNVFTTKIYEWDIGSYAKRPGNIGLHGVQTS